jgi:catechol 2,3-dioxygenase-like lactoylglutathione lyase family enzyme
MIIKAVHHVQISIPKGAEDEARAFYKDILGLREIPKPASLAGRGGFWLELGATQIHFGAEDGVDRQKTKAHAAYLVDDLEEWRQKLPTHGCEVINGIPIPGYERFEFRDPFGNRVEFLQTTA